MAEEKGKRGRPKIAYDKNLADQIQAMSQYGTPQDEIAEMVNLSLLTLRKLYSKELKHGYNIAKLSVRKKLYEHCMAGDTACLIFYAKTQLKWREADKDTPSTADNLKQLADSFREAFKSVGKCRS